MKTTAILLFLALLFLGGCATTAQEPAAVRRDHAISILRDHGFAPPMSIEAADSATWIVSSRPSRSSPRSVDRVVVTIPGHVATPTVEIRRYVRGPTDWAIVGSLFGGDETAAEARAIHGKLERRLAPN